MFSTFLCFFLLFGHSSAQNPCYLHLCKLCWPLLDCNSLYHYDFFGFMDSHLSHRGLFVPHSLDTSIPIPSPNNMQIYL